MASVEITDNTIIRSLVRKGTNDERRQITLEEGELGYTTDTKRLFVGDAIGSGIIAGTKYLGNQTSWPASLTPQPGDFFTLNGGLYARKNNIGEDDNLGEPEGYDRIGLAGNPGTGLGITDGSLNVLVDENTINFTFDNKLQVNEINFSNLPNAESYTLIGNNIAGTNEIQTISVGENSFLGRIASGDLQSTTFDELLTNANDPTMSSLKLTGLANQGTKAIYVDNNGQITTTNNSFTSNFLASNPGGGNYLGAFYELSTSTSSNNMTPGTTSSFTDVSNYLGWGVSMLIDNNVTYKRFTFDIDNVRTAVNNTDITWDQIQDFTFQFTSKRDDPSIGFFGYYNAQAGQNIILNFDPINVKEGKIRQTSVKCQNYLIPNSYVSGTESMTIHLGNNYQIPVQVRLVGITIKG